MRTSFTFLGVGFGCNLSITASGTTHFLPDHTTPQNYMMVLGPWIFCRFSTHLLTVRCSTKVCRVSSTEASLPMTILYHWCNRPTLLMWERTGTVLGLPTPDILWGCIGSFGEALKRSIVAPSPWTKIDPGTQQARIYWKKHLLSQVQPGTFLGLWSKYVRWW